MLEVAQIGERVAEALAAAHEREIIHRDIKPENILIRPDGYTKVVDFGLATNPLATDARAAGSFRYMAPEQARGHPATAAADVFSLGVVLYELAAGVHPFGLTGRSDTTLAVLEAIASAPPRIPVAIASKLPRKLGSLISRMLSGRPENRPPMTEVARELGSITRRSDTRMLPLAGAFAILAILAVWHVFDQPAKLPAVRIAQLTSYAGSETQSSLSPDGKTVAFCWTGADAGNRHIYIKTVQQEQPRCLTCDADDEVNPVFSRDGRWIAFLRQGARSSAPHVVIVPVQGGPERDIATVVPVAGFRALAWWPDGESILVRDQQRYSSGLVRVFIRDGRKVPFLETPPGANDWLPTISGDGRTVAFARGVSGSTYLCLAGRDGTRPTCHDARTFNGIAWLPGDRGVLLGNGRELRMLETRGRRAGNITQLAVGSFQELAGDPSGRHFTFSRVLTDVNIWKMEANGVAVRFIASSGEDSEPAWSPDGKRVVIRSNRSGQWELYSYASDGTDEKQLTHFGSHLGSARWSPDGKWLAFDGNGAGFHPPLRCTNIFLVPAEGGTVRRLTDDSQSYLVPAWSRDGSWIYSEASRPSNTVRISVVDGHVERLADESLFDVVESPDSFLYYRRPDLGGGIFRRPVSGGPESLVPGTEGVNLYRYWALGPHGLFFVDGPPNTTLRFWDSRTAKQTWAAPIRTALARGPRGLAVSPDGKSVLYASEDLSLSDIMLLEFEGT